MKEIKAYVRREQLTAVVAQLEQAGVSGISITEIHPVGYGYEPEYFRLGPEDVFHQHPQTMAKIELVCSSGKVQQFVEMIRDNAKTGYRGDGIIFVSPIEHARRIRDDAVDHEAL
jgi:nitrogen regulatory protein PII